MSIYKRGKTYWVSFTAPNGQRIRCSSGTKNKNLAQEYHDKLRVKYWDAQKLGNKPDRTWKEVALRFIKETDHKASHSRDLIYLNWLDPFLKDLMLSNINRNLIDLLIEHRLKEGVANATVNRLLACLRTILRKAKYDWEWIDNIPKVRLLPESKIRVRWLTPKEASKLIMALPEHQSAAVHFALLTGLRQGNIKELEWSQVDLERARCWIHPDQAKAGKAIGVPLNTDALTILRAQVGKHPTRVFTYRSKPINQLTTKVWYRTLRELDIKDFRWHDLRHTWASWHVQNGTPLNVLQELGGWKSVEMVRRYAHLGQTHLANYSENSSQLR